MFRNIVMGTKRIINSECRKNWFQCGYRYVFIKHLSTSLIVLHKSLSVDQSHIIRTNPYLEKKFQKIDNVPTNFKLIYRYKEMLSHKFMITSTLFVFIITIISAVYHFITSIPSEVEIHDHTFENPQKLYIIAYVLVFLCIFTIDWALKKIAIRIYFDKSTNTYKIISYNYNPFQTTCTEFVHNRKSLLQQYLLFNYLKEPYQIKVKDKKFFVYSDNFRTFSDMYNLIYGSKNKPQ